MQTSRTIGRRCASPRPEGLGEHNCLMWSRGSEINDLPKHLTRRMVFSYCGEMVAHYPVGSWLRTAAAFIKREANSATSSSGAETSTKRSATFMEIEYLVCKRFRQGKAEYPAKWKDHSWRSSIWLAEEDLHGKQLIVEFEERERIMQQAANSESTGTPRFAKVDGTGEVVRKVKPS
ncbi:hypothetical protein M514_02142 [Trichuris suis]|uniref:Chromo domain-containing protein n=1 Tax=Trichuris suis TaxID=68888 RepID=A0A085MI39_9BILA|nr:hypothetical protein M513_02142 [Trichuris suis]KFD66121.1 hypothetical protein M514_02142 [Trichuris suis]